MKKLMALSLAALMAASTSLAGVDNPRALTGTAVNCVAAPDSAHANGYRLDLAFGSLGDYHRDGYWYQTELNGPVLHTYTFVASLSYRYSGRASGLSFEAFINREGVSFVQLEDIQGTLDPDNLPIGFTGKAVQRDGQFFGLTCSYRAGN